jgi:transcriptional regulator with XRE-family HTH domain
MIKNDNQAQRIEARLLEIQQELAHIRRTAAPAEVAFWSLSLEDELKTLGRELKEYRWLKTASFEKVVSRLLREPVAIEALPGLLARLRVAAGLTQGEMASRLGWRQPNVSRFENEAASSHSVDKISEYAGALGVGLFVTPALATEPPVSPEGLLAARPAESPRPRPRPSSYTAKMARSH